MNFPDLCNRSGVFPDVCGPGCEQKCSAITQQDRIEQKLDQVLLFLEELRPLLEVAKTFTSGSKMEKARAMIRNGRG